MRISTSTIFDKGTARMGELQTSLANTQQQVSTGRRILTPADDPVASARALDVTNSQAINSQYAVNRRNAKDSLSATEGALQNVTSLLQDVKVRIVEAGGGALDDTQRGYIATELQGTLDELVGFANSKDGAGNYLFSGYMTSTQPFTSSATGAQYAGDQGSRQMQVASGRQIEVADNGNALFEQINSTGLFASASSGNGGNGTISTGTVLDASKVKAGHSYSINFTVTGPTTTYNVVDTTDQSTPVTLSTGNAYTSGQPIIFDGLQFSVSGTPNNNDSFTVQPNGKQSIFTTLKNLITALQTPASDTTSRNNLAYGLSVANGNVDNALDHVLTARASVGASLKEIDSLDNMGDDMDVQYTQSLSQLQDLDYVQGISNLMKQQNALQAAQQSFAKVAGMSLFNYING
ncbi:MAG TPA: flagellar hook-associated protein FlgL [Noviherbaspirillum sp.]|uniref:flagellar hook-associated protein FlgL n=1 Tax=Noviherbaspirillum sp. TaxID=1926288 RepID=UPI002B46CB82|nr:flagellar hook-associated protein FlgL [Noviherbaspirillum sp.]HJV88490.1 flagellar hook-associated protein FlgL [Noviherbaspirillum sp.]